MSNLPEPSIMQRWMDVWTVHFLPDDRLFVALLATWVLALAAITNALLGWAAAAGLVTVTGFLSLATVAVETRKDSP